MFNVTENSDTLKAYSDWAETATSNNQVAGRKGNRLMNLSKATSPLARLFNRTSVDLARQAAVATFKAALTETVGETIADQVWRAIENDVNAKGLTAALVRTAIAETNRLVDWHTKLIPQKIRDSNVANVVIGFSNGLLEGAENVKFTISAQKFKDSYEIFKCLEKADQLLCKMPMSRASAEALVKKLDQTWSSLGSAKIFYHPKEEVEKLITSKMDALHARKLEIEELKDKMPDGDEALNGLAKHWQTSLAKAFEMILNNDKVQDLLSDETKGNLKKEFKHMKILYLSNDGWMLEKVKSDKKKLLGNIQKELMACVKEACHGKIPADVKKALKDVFKKSHLQVLNTDKESWKPITNSFNGYLNGKTFTLESDITCGRHIDQSIAEEYDKEGDKDVQSYNCHTKNTANAVNLATTKLQLPDENGKMRTVFSGVRHGGHSAEKVQGKTTSQANIQRAKQTVTAAVKSYLDAHSNSLKGLKTEKDGNGEMVYKLPMTSISLLTPTKIEERKMLNAQNAAWNAIKKEGVLTVKVNGQEYRVKPEIQTVNYGVNSGAVGVFSFIAGGWAETVGMNEKGLKGLLNQANTFAANCTDQKIKNAVKTLTAQIVQIAMKNGHMLAGLEPYKMPARIAVLTNLIGGVPVWNCKSGKDRTGMLDVEAKFLATLIDRGQRIPMPNEKLSKEQKDLLDLILMKSGNLEMQKYNTGIPGYKLKGVGAIYKRLGADQVEKTSIRGGSGYIGS